MIKQFICWLWEHKYLQRLSDVVKIDGKLYQRQWTHRNNYCLRCGADRKKYMQTEKWEDEYHKFIDSLPERVGETPRSVVLEFIRSQREQAKREGVEMAIEAIPIYEHSWLCAAKGGAFKECLYCFKQSLKSKLL